MAYLILCRKLSENIVDLMLSLPGNPAMRISASNIMIMGC